MIRGDPKSVDQEFPLLICADRRKDLCRQLPEASCDTGHARTYLCSNVLAQLYGSNAYPT